MSNLIIVKPLPMTVGGTFPNVARVLTPDPKEASIYAVTGGGSIDIDLGSVVTVDTIFVGYVSGFAGASDLTITSGTASYTTTARGTVALAPSDIAGARRHYLAWFPVPFDARYIRIAGTFVAGFTVGNVVVGKAFIPTWGHEYGAGRPITDTSNVERLFGGGFGIDEGVTVGGYQWTLGDLQPDELRALYALARDRGTARSTLVVEDPDYTDGLNERIHWGLFGKLEPYNRVNPLDTTWSFSIADWG